MFRHNFKWTLEQRPEDEFIQKQQNESRTINSYKAHDAELLASPLLHLFWAMAQRKVDVFNVGLSYFYLRNPPLLFSP